MQRRGRRRETVARETTSAWWARDVSYPQCAESDRSVHHLHVLAKQAASLPECHESHPTFVTAYARRLAGETRHVVPPFFLPLFNTSNSPRRRRRCCRQSIVWSVNLRRLCCCVNEKKFSPVGVERASSLQLDASEREHPPVVGLGPRSARRSELTWLFHLDVYDDDDEAEDGR